MNKLEKATHVCLIAVCIVAVASLIEQRLDRQSRGMPRAKDLVGKVFNLPGISGHPLALVLGLTTSCRYCAESMPLYREMAAFRRQHPSSAPLFVVSPNPVEKVIAYLTQNGVSVDNVIQADFAALGIRATPTLVAVDSKNIVRNAFIGKQSEAGRSQVLAIMQGSVMRQAD